jgi:esterase/lipase
MSGKSSLLYLHGLDSQPTPLKTHMLSTFGMSVIAPQMHYREEKQLYNRLIKLCKYFNVQWIVGSSIGGYVAYWLSQDIGIPCILINPALSFRSLDTALVPSDISFTKAERIVFIGEKDNVVIPEDTIQWIRNFNPDDMRGIQILPDVGHRVTADYLRNLVSQCISNPSII